MDNLTHSLIGYTVAAAGLELHRRRQKRLHLDPPELGWKRAILVASVVGNNLPDLDVLLSPLIRMSAFPTIMQLLHHRGHTHTLIFAPLLAFLGAWITRWITRRSAESRPSFGLLWAVCAIGSVTHVIADFWNEYGVHPFWPLDSRWYYGDMVFILEPLAWAILGSFVVWDVRNRAIRGFLILPQVLIVLAAWRMTMIPAAVATAMTAILLVCHALQWKYRSVVLAVGLILGLMSSLAVARLMVRDEVMQAFRAGGAADSERIQQLITSPAPANPFCWRTLVVSVDETQDRYRVVAGGVSIWPRVFSPETCAFRVPGEGSQTAQTKPSALEHTSHVHWYGEYASSWTLWQKLANESCSVSAFLRFARAPFRAEIQGLGVVFGDMRYDREVGLGFAEYVDQAGKCPEVVPPWGQPIFQ